jgi:DNA-binding NtrC family response regulator
VEGGRQGTLTSSAEEARAALARRRYRAAIVDLDRRPRDGMEIVRTIRQLAPEVTVIAILPVGGVDVSVTPSPSYHLSLEKPWRTQALMAALATATTPRPATLGAE